MEVIVMNEEYIYYYFLKYYNQLNFEEKYNVFDEEQLAQSLYYYRNMINITLHDMSQMFQPEEIKYNVYKGIEHLRDFIMETVWQN
jgi:hypothetical protein